MGKQTKNDFIDKSVEKPVIHLNEMETSIQYNRTEKIATIWTNDPVVMRKLDIKVADYPENYKIKEVGRKNGYIVSKTYTCKKNLIQFRSGKNKIYTEEEKEILRARLAKIKNRKSFE